MSSFGKFFNSFNNINNRKTKKSIRKYKKYEDKFTSCKNKTKQCKTSNQSIYNSKQKKYIKLSVYRLSNYYKNKLIKKIEYHTTKSFFGGFHKIELKDVSLIKKYIMNLFDIYKLRECELTSEYKLDYRNIITFLDSKYKYKQTISVPILEMILKTPDNLINLDYLNSNLDFFKKFNEMLKIDIKDCS